MLTALSVYAKEEFQKMYIAKLEKENEELKARCKEFEHYLGCIVAVGSSPDMNKKLVGVKWEMLLDTTLWDGDYKATVLALTEHLRKFKGMHSAAPPAIYPSLPDGGWFSL